MSIAVDAPGAAGNGNGSETHPFSNVSCTTFCSRSSFLQISCARLACDRAVLATYLTSISASNFSLIRGFHFMIEVRL